VPAISALVSLLVMGTVAANSIIPHLLDSHVARSVLVLDPAKTVFDDLMRKDLISPSRRLVRKQPYSRVVNFRTSRFHPDTIYAIGNVSKLPEGSITFALLHEEGHKTERQNSRWVLAAMGCVGAPTMALAIWHGISGIPSGALDWAIYLSGALFVLFCPRIFRRWIFMDETRADLFAARTMKRAYPGITTREVADAARIALRAAGRKRKGGLEERLVLDWMGWEVHPKDEERIEKIMSLDLL